MICCVGKLVRSRPIGAAPRVRTLRLNRPRPDEIATQVRALERIEKNMIVRFGSRRARTALPPSRRRCSSNWRSRSTTCAKALRRQSAWCGSGARSERTVTISFAQNARCYRTGLRSRQQHNLDQLNVRFSNRPVGVKRFQTIHHDSVDVAHGLVLLFGIGTRALPSWDSKTRRNNLWGGLAVRQTAGPSGHTISPHPSSREGHHSTARWTSVFSCHG